MRGGPPRPSRRARTRRAVLLRRLALHAPTMSFSSTHDDEAEHLGDLRDELVRRVSTIQHAPHEAEQCFLTTARSHSPAARLGAAAAREQSSAASAATTSAAASCTCRRGRRRRRAGAPPGWRTRWLYLPTREQKLVSVAPPSMFSALYLRIAILRERHHLVDAHAAHANAHRPSPRRRRRGPCTGTTMEQQPTRRAVLMSRRRGLRSWAAPRCRPPAAPRARGAPSRTQSRTPRSRRSTRHAPQRRASPCARHRGSAAGRRRSHGRPRGS